MKKITLLTSLLLLVSAMPVFANDVSALAAPGSTQFVTIMNNLANPKALDYTKSDVMVKYYDGTGNNPPCWTENKLEFRKDPNIGGAGGKNACGVKGVTPAAIVKVDIIPLKMPVGKLYEDLLDVKIDTSKFFNVLLIEQDTAPVYHSNGSLKTLGTLKVKQLTDGE